METSDKVRCVACWACRTSVEVPKVNGEWVSEFKCGWCGAITSMRPISSKGRYGLLLPSPENCCSWRLLNCVSLMSQFGAVAFVVCLLLTLMLVGIFGLLPNAFINTSNLLWSQILAVFISVNILINYILAATKSSRSVSNRLPQIQGGTVPKGVYDGYRFCVSCQTVKAPNVHHCSVCNACIEEMDHHCPFIGNCVGRRNLRSFILFLIWTGFGAIYAMIVCVVLMIKSFPLVMEKSPRRASVWNWPSIVQNYLPWWCLASYYTFVVALTGGIGVFVLLSTQLHQIWNGHTYIEQLKGQTSSYRTETFFTRLGRIFGGNNPLYWLLPFATERMAHDKVEWKVR
eukprot:g4648.t1